jgi:hypothetical protein
MFIFVSLLVKWGLCYINNIRNDKSRLLPIILCTEYLKQGNPELKNASRMGHASSMEKNVGLKILMLAPLGDKVWM